MSVSMVFNLDSKFWAPIPRGHRFWQIFSSAPIAPFGLFAVNPKC